MTSDHNESDAVVDETTSTSTSMPVTGGKRRYKKSYTNY